MKCLLVMVMMSFTGTMGQIDFKVAVVQTSFMADLGMISSLVKMVTTYFLVMVETTN